jgi:hypothetical protein
MHGSGTGDHEPGGKDLVVLALWPRWRVFKPFVTGPNRIPIPPRRTGMRTVKKLWRNRKARKELTRRLQSENPGLDVVHLIQASALSGLEFPITRKLHEFARDIQSRNFSSSTLVRI